MKLKCLHCEYKFDGSVGKDDLGWHSSCPECGCSFDVDINTKRIWFRVGMEAEVSEEELTRLKECKSEDLMRKIIKRAELSGDTYIPEKYIGCEDYDNPDYEIDFLF